MNFPYLIEHITWKKPSPHEGIVLRDLLDNDGVSTKDRLLNQLYGSDPDGGPLCVDDCLSILIFHLRHKLIPGWTIRCWYNRLIILNETTGI